MTRRGVSLPEVLVALVLGLLLVQAGLGSVARLESGRARLAARVDALVAERIARHVVRRETRIASQGVDWDVAADSLWLRAFRGVGVVCAVDSASASVAVSFTGDRSVDPAKDSVLLLDALGFGETRALVSASSVGSCGPGSARWVLDRGAPAGVVLVRVFERGSYHLADSALRYRRGASGRQPLTPAVWSRATAWVDGGGQLGMRLVPIDPGAGPPWSGFVAWMP